MDSGAITEKMKKEAVIQLASSMMHKYYCENDTDAVTGLLSEPFIWIGAGEEEYAVGSETVTDIFAHFKGQVPRCTISDEEYDVIQLAPDVFLCTGRVWIVTDPSTDIYLRVHQRLTIVFKWDNGRFLCCHIHISNPYSEMSDEDVGFPEKMARESCAYLKEQLEIQKQLLEKQTSALKRLSFEDSLTGLFNRNKFNQEIEVALGENSNPLGIAYFDLNGLKEVNDHLGHSAGDDLIRQTACHISRIFEGKGYRIGGDEFVVIDHDSDESSFSAAVSSVCRNMEQDGISCSVGLSWREYGSIMEQFDEADKLMYQSKKQFYSSQEYDRRHLYG